MAPSCLDLPTNWSCLHWEIIMWLSVCACSGTRPLSHLSSHAHLPTLLLATFPFTRQWIQPREPPAFWMIGKLGFVIPRLKVTRWCWSHLGKGSLGYFNDSKWVCFSSTGSSFLGVYAGRLQIWPQFCTLPLQCDFAPSEIECVSLPLNLGWPCDSFCLIDGEGFLWQHEVWAEIRKYEE